MSATLNFAASPRNASGLISAANTNLDGSTGTRVTIFTAGASGSRVDSVIIKGVPAFAAVIAANIVRLWVNNGVASFLIHEEVLAANTTAIGVASPEIPIALNIQLPIGYLLEASTHIATSYHVTAMGGDY